MTVSWRRGKQPQQTQEKHVKEIEVGQLMVIGFDGTEMNPALRETLARYRPAGVILFARNLVSGEQTRKLTAKLQAIAEELEIGPLLIGLDHEGGVVVRPGAGLTPFPGNMALAAAGSLDLARRQAQAMAAELLALGVNWDFAPCVDVNSNPRNPVIGVRSFGDDPAEVGKFGAAMTEGFQNAGVIACAKHFPGHGDTEVDSHLGLPSVNRSLAELRKIDLPPFQAAIEAGVASIMTAHVVFPALEEQLPATVSEKAMTGLLREEMGFEGVIASDALEMAGLTEFIGVGEGAVACINAGVDIVLACNDPAAIEAAYAGLQQAQVSERLNPEKARQALARIAALKLKFLGKKSQPAISCIGGAEHLALEGEIAARATTLLREKPGTLPLRGKVALRPIGLEGIDLTPLQQALPTGADPAAPETVIFVIGDLRRRPELLAPLREKLDAAPFNILLSLGYPADVELLPEAATVICAYSTRPAALQAAAAVLSGAAPAAGSYPLAGRGYNLFRNLDKDSSLRSE
jgi:beta-N-acetylhexosaminidase